MLVGQAVANPSSAALRLAWALAEGLCEHRAHRPVDTVRRYHKVCELRCWLPTESVPSSTFNSTFNCVFKSKFDGTVMSLLQLAPDAILAF